MVDKKISVIVPAYNVEKYIERCIRSIVNQSYKNIEIIIVDDGSSDATGYICDELMQLDDRISVIHMENRGVSAARNKGLDLATGYYLSLIDSDDCVDTEMFKRMVDVSVKYDADIVACGYSIQDTKGNIKKRGSATGKCKEYDVNCAFANIHRIKFECWNKLYKRNVVGETRFKIGQTYEELFFEHIVFFKSNKIVYYDFPFYNYTENREGGTLSKFDKGRMSIMTEYASLISDLDRNNMIEGTNTIVCFAINHMIQNYWAMITFDIYDNRNELHKLVKKIYGSHKNKLNLGLKERLIFDLFCINPNITYRLHNARKR